MSEELTLQGTCDSRFERVRELFSAGFARGEKFGAAVSLVVDLWAGHRDEARTAPS